MRSAIVSHKDILAPRIESSIEEKNFLEYLKWQNDKELITTIIINPFRNKALENVDLGSEEMIKKPYVINDIHFEISLKKTTKRPSYKSAIENFKKEIEMLKTQYDRGMARKGYKTIDGELFLEMGYVVGVLKESIEKSKKGKEGFERKFELISPENLKKFVPRKVTIVFGQDYSVQTESNARIFVESNNFLHMYDEYAEEFKKKVRDDSFDILGREISKAAAVLYSFDNYRFQHIIIPRYLIKYQKVIESLTKEPPRNITKKSKIGDMEKIKLIIIDGAEEFLKEKKLLDEHFLNDYKPTRAGDRIFLRADGILKRVRDYENKFRNLHYQQPLNQL